MLTDVASDSIHFGPLLTFTRALWGAWFPPASLVLTQTTKGSPVQSGRMFVMSHRFVGSSAGAEEVVGGEEVMRCATMSRLCS